MIAPNRTDFVHASRGGSRRTLWSMACWVLAGAAVLVDARAAPLADEAREILKRSVAFPTVEGRGQVPAYAQYLGQVLRSGGYAPEDVAVTPFGETATLVARLRGTGSGKPILLLGHMDVVDADPKDWKRDPFVPVEEGGFLYGRGAEDNKYDIALMVATLVALKREGFQPRRDVVLVLTGDEETSAATTRKLAEEFRDAELALNGDGGIGVLDRDHKPLYYSLQVGEKTYADFALTFTGPGGHSSEPDRDNVIYRLSAALSRLAAHAFPVEVNPVTRAWLDTIGRYIGGDLGVAMTRLAANPNDAAAAEIISASPEYVGKIRTTCVATMVEAGHAVNALPQRASATINCRIMPGVEIAAVEQSLRQVIADPRAEIQILGAPMASDASPLRADIVAAVTKAVHARHPGLPVIPSISAGATDSLFFRAHGVPSYGISALFVRSEDSNPHGLDEAVPITDLAAALAHYRSLIVDLSR